MFRKKTANIFYKLESTMELVFKVNVVAPILKRWYVISRQGGIIRSYQQLRNRNLLRHCLHTWRLNSKHEGIATLDMWASSNYKRNVRAFHSVGAGGNGSAESYVTEQGQGAAANGNGYPRNTTGSQNMNLDAQLRPSQGLAAIGSASHRASQSQSQGRVAEAARKSTGQTGGRDSPPQAAEYDVDDNGDEYDVSPVSPGSNNRGRGPRAVESSPSNRSNASNKSGNSNSNWVNVHATSENNITKNHRNMMIRHKPSNGVAFDEDDFDHE